VFAAAGALEKLDAFASIHGADFYGLPRNGGTITLVPEPWEVPARYPFGTEELVPLRAGERIAWRLASHE
jgi:dihydroorotase